MARREALIVRTGTANLASVQAGLQRAGAEPRLTTDPEAVRAADWVALPGVGAFEAARAPLAARGLDQALIERIEQGRPTLGICLGLQLLGSGSEESPGVAGLGVFDGVATRFDAAARVPQLGWNRITAGAGCRLLTDGYVYFANSYRLTEIPPGWRGAMSDHGGPFVAALERGDVLGCQFHPELSGAFGQQLLKRWLWREEGSC